MFERLEAEFGKDHVARIRRELTTRDNRVPTYIELLARLCLLQGPHQEPLEEK